MDLSPLYAWAAERGYAAKDEYIVMHGVPVQILAASSSLELEAVRHANVLDYGGVPVRVMRPEYLIVMYVITGGDKRRGRARDLFAEGVVEDARIEELLDRHQLRDLWHQKGGQL